MTSSHSRHNSTHRTPRNVIITPALIPHLMPHSALVFSPLTRRPPLSLLLPCVLRQSTGLLVASFCIPLAAAIVMNQLVRDEDASAVIQPFRFNFTIDGGEEDEGGRGDDDRMSDTTAPPLPHPPKRSIEEVNEEEHTIDPSNLIPGQRVDPLPVLASISSSSSSSTLSAPVVVPLTASFSPLRHVVSNDATELSVHTRRSDVVHGVYEGGFKVWECAIDLIDSLSSLPSPSPSPPSLPSPLFERVLELGCGHGFPGLFCLLHKGAAHVTFQDLNAEVLTHCAIPNVHANLVQHCGHNQQAASAELIRRCSFISGDWSHPSLVALLPPHSFTLILTSDTLYEPKTIPALVRLCRHCLAPHGRLLVASKRFYFGVGGGSVELFRVLEAERDLTATVERVMEDGKSNIREVLVIQWKDTDTHREGGQMTSDC